VISEKRERGVESRFVIAQHSVFVAAAGDARAERAERAADPPPGTKI
jgi:hypothetical protein